VNLVLVGLNHRTAPVEVRERYAVPLRRCSDLVAKLVLHPDVEEAAILSTCNRTELFAVSREPGLTLERLREFLVAEVGAGASAPPSGQLFEATGSDAVAHLLRVATGLESMVLGEAQILGQVKGAWRAAIEARGCGPVLHRLFQRAFRAAKQVRSQTGLGAASVSVARVGVQLAGEVFERFDDKRVLVLGAGEMAESALRGLREAGAGEVCVVNRSREPAERLAARVGGRAAPLDALAEELARSDIALASIDVERPLVGVDTLAPAVRSRAGRPLLVIDLGIPRNVEPSVNELADVYLYDLDDLEEVAERGRARRAASAPEAERIVALHVGHFERWLARLPAAPVIRELVQRAEATARAEAAHAASRLDGGSPAVREALERAAVSLVRKLLHRPIERLREDAESSGGLYYTEAVRDLFGPDDEEDGGSE
jgi:glutamyl-tRNA reductase